MKSHINRPARLRPRGTPKAPQRLREATRVWITSILTQRIGRRFRPKKKPRSSHTRSCLSAMAKKSTRALVQLIPPNMFMSMPVKCSGRSADLMRSFEPSPTKCSLTYSCLVAKVTHPGSITPTTAGRTSFWQRQRSEINSANNTAVGCHRIPKVFSVVTPTG